MTAESYFMINLHESMIELATPGSAVRLATDCPTGPSDDDDVMCQGQRFQTRNPDM